MAEVYLPSLLQLLITSDYLLLLHTLHRAPLIVTRYLLALGGYSSTKTKQGAKVQPVHTQKLRCLLGIGRGTNEVWAACQPVRDHYVGGWSASHVYRGGTCTVGPTCDIGRWRAAVLITMIATVSNYCMNTIFGGA